MESILKNILYALLGAVSFGILFRVPKQQLILVTILGASTELVQHLVQRYVDLTVATFFAALYLGLLSHFISRRNMEPVQGYLIPGVIFLLPGRNIYLSFVAALNRNLDTASIQILTTLALGVSITTAILLANWLLPSRQRI